ncbi:MAG TPA: alpha/beta hydrolase-fold protein [Pseudonocardia sp.]|nr:alpha/beta hydrolase-fold protein [Pseudonocardia sp.]
MLGRDADGQVRVAGPWVEEHRIGFAVDDPGHRFAGIRLRHEPTVPDTEFAFDEGCWRLTLPRPPIHRMEYQFELSYPDGRTEIVTDPDNPTSTPGAFGPKSVLELPGYAAPAWLDRAAPWPVRAELDIETAAGSVAVTVRSPDAPTSRLLVAHDGPEYDALAGLAGFAAAMVAERRVPPFQLALAAPGARDERYSANPAYTTALATQVLPRLHHELGTTGPVVLMGASLGALASLDVQRRHPGRVAGLFLQSGSFFTTELDACEADFPHFARIVDSVRAVHVDRPPGRPVRTVLTCGAAEENLANNRLLAATLRAQGYPAALREVPDAHNYVAWRDAFDPHLAGLLREVWGDA